jgi:gliding motility-associated-like protein
MKYFYILTFLMVCFKVTSQNFPNDCYEAVPGCSNPSFHIYPPNSATDNFDFGQGVTSNPSTNPNPSPGNSGCLLSGETSSTFITITCVTSGTLQWSIIGTSGGCFDWIMWPYIPPVGNATSATCTGLQNNTIAPIACNWNGSCNGNTGMAPAGNLPPGGDQSSYENPLNVTAGQIYLLCLSNYSSTDQDVNLNFFGSAQVACSVSAPDQTICLGNSATVNIATPGYTNPTFQWLVTTGVSNPTGGSNVTVTPTVTTTYSVAVHQDASAGGVAIDDTATFTITVNPPPAPNAGIDDTVCFGTPILLHGQVASATNTVSWQPISTGISPTPTVSFSPNNSNLNPTVTVNQPGLYKFVLRESNATCGIYRDTVKVLVSRTQQTVSQISPSCTGQSDGSIIIHNNSAVAYSFDNGANWGLDSVSSIFPVGTYSVCSRNIHGCITCSNITVVDPPALTLTVSNDTLICQNGTATLNALATGYPMFSYNWAHNPTDLSAQQVVSPTQDGYYSVYAQTASGCITPTDSIYVTIRPGLSGTITSDITICPGYPDTLFMTATGGIGSPYTIAWSTGQTASGNQDYLIGNPTTTTNYTVTVTDACESTPLILSSNIIVALLPVPLITVDANQKCEPAIFNLTNITDPSMVSGVIWNISNGENFVNIDQISTLPLDAGFYTVQLIVKSPNGCIDSVTWTDYLESINKPEADFQYSPNPIKMFNTQVYFTNTSQYADTYQWFVDQALPSYSSDENFQTQFPDGVAATYNATLIAESNFGCKDTITKLVTVYPEVLIYAPNSFTPDGDEHNQQWGIYIEGIDTYHFNLLIFNRWGEVIWESNDPKATWDGTYNGQVVKEGTYIWRVQAKDILNDDKHEFKGFINILK